MASLRKYPKMLPPPKRSWFTVDRTLLMGVFALVGLGFAQSNFGTSGVAPSSVDPAQQIATRPVADYTPVGSIERSNADKKTDAEKKDKPALQAPFGLRSAR